MNMHASKNIFTTTPVVNRKQTKLDMSSSDIIPRAAVSVVVRHALSSSSRPTYVLVKRGKEPNKGMWSLPGGKIEAGEKSLAAAKRELQEETGLFDLRTSDSRLQSMVGTDDSKSVDFIHTKLQWSEEGPICTTDSIHFDKNAEKRSIQYHYVISQWFVEIVNEVVHGEISTSDPECTGLNSDVATSMVPTLVAADDAADAKWFNLEDIKKGIEFGNITPGVERVILRSEHMYEKGIL
jgi:ADP-ribose pyrophosphatase YjhB (NUDIX family)